MSAFNRVERTFARVHDNLVDVVAEDTINGVVPKDDEGKNQLLDKAAKLVCELENRSKNIAAIIDPGFVKYADLEEWREFFKKPKSNWNDSDRLKCELYLFLVKHAKRLEDILLFYPCTSSDCDHCVELRSNTRCPKLMQQLDFQGIIIHFLFHSNW
jgi:hypothetical protein